MKKLYLILLKNELYKNYKKNFEIIDISSFKNLRDNSLLFLDKDNLNIIKILNKKIFILLQIQRE